LGESLFALIAPHCALAQFDKLRHLMGRTADVDAPAVTDSRAILNRLLIDLFIDPIEPE